MIIKAEAESSLLDPHHVVYFQLPVFLNMSVLQGFVVNLYIVKSWLCPAPVLLHDALGHSSPPLLVGVPQLQGPRRSKIAVSLIHAHMLHGRMAWMKVTSWHEYMSKIFEDEEATDQKDSNKTVQYKVAVILCELPRL